MRQQYKNAVQGFTLFELLVCIVIIAILSGIVLPSALGAVDTFRSCHPGVATITSHEELSSIGFKPIVTGNIEPLPRSKQAFVFVQTPQGKYWLDPINIDKDGQWTALELYVGEEVKNIGESFQLGLITVNSKEAKKILSSKTYRNDINDLPGCIASRMIPVVRK